MPNTADAGASVAWGRGLYEATAGDTAAFTVQARDANGNNRLTSQVQTFLSVQRQPMLTKQGNRFLVLYNILGITCVMFSFYAS